MRVWAGLFFCTAMIAPASAQTPAAAPPTPHAASASGVPVTTQQVPAAQVSISGWRLQCSSAGAQLNCTLIDQVTQANGAQIMTISVVRPSASAPPTAVVVVPLGMAIAGGVRLGFENGAVQALRIITCTRLGCVGRAQLGEPALAAMKAAKAPLRIAYDALAANGAAQTVTISLGLDGFAAAYDRLR